MQSWECIWLGEKGCSWVSCLENSKFLEGVPEPGFQKVAARRGCMVREGYLLRTCGVLERDWYKAEFERVNTFTLDHLVMDSRGVGARGLNALERPTGCAPFLDSLLPSEQLLMTPLPGTPCGRGKIYFGILGERVGEW